MRLVLVLAVLGIVGVSTPAWAHHSFAAEYDGKKAVKLTGAVTKIDWSNPHVYFYIDVEDEAGHVANWAFEMGAPGALKNSGWTRTSMKIGDLVTVEGTQAKDGGTHANARAVILTTTGQRLGAASSQGK